MMQPGTTVVAPPAGMGGYGAMQQPGYGAMQQPGVPVSY